MSDKVATFWIITGQGETFKLGDGQGAFRTKTFNFRLSEENYNSWGLITLMARGVSFSKNKVSINGNFVGYLSETKGSEWATQTLIVEVGSFQKFGDGNNEITIEAFNSEGGTSGNLDDFEVKHLVFEYRTHR